MKKYVFLIFTGLLGLFAGCQKEAQVDPTTPVCLESVSMDQLFSATENVLTGMHFEIDKADLEARQIVTRPLRGAQFFEFWRQDNATAADYAESNLHSLQRIAEVRFEQSGSAICANCRVLVRRLSLPELSDRDIHQSRGLFADKRGHVQSLRLPSERAQQAEWIYLGQDPALEQVILRKIEDATK